MSGTYARQTTVPVEKTVADLQKLLTQSKAHSIATVVNPLQRSIAFQFGQRTVRFDVKIERWEDHRLTRTAQGRTMPQAKAAAAAEDRRRWREVYLLVKALLVAIDAGILTVEDAFLAQTVLPTGTTVGGEVGELLRLQGYERALPSVTTMPAIGTGS